MEKAKEISDIIEPFGMFIIAAIVAWIAYMQFKTDRDRLRLELYEKRFSVYEALKALLIKLQTNHTLTKEDIIYFKIATNEAVFLFDEDIVEYLSYVSINAHATWIMDDLQKPERPVKLLKNTKEISNWVQEQLEVSREKFSKYLRFKTKD